MSTLKQLAIVGVVGLIGSIALANATARKQAINDQVSAPSAVSIPCTVQDNATPAVTGDTFDKPVRPEATERCK